MRNARLYKWIKTFPLNLNQYFATIFEYLFRDCFFIPCYSVSIYCELIFMIFFNHNWNVVIVNNDFILLAIVKNPSNKIYLSINVRALGTIGDVIINFWLFINIHDINIVGCLFFSLWLYISTGVLYCCDIYVFIRVIILPIETNTNISNVI